MEKRELSLAESTAKAAIEAQFTSEIANKPFSVNSTVDESTGKLTNYGRVEVSPALAERISKATESLKNSGHYLSTDLGDGFRSSILSVKDNICLFTIWESSFVTVTPGMSLRDALAGVKPRSVTQKEAIPEQAPF